MTLTILADSHRIIPNELNITFGADGIVHGKFHTPSYVPKGMVDILQVIYENRLIVFRRCVIESLFSEGLADTAYKWVCKGGIWNE